jgi:hypothetical protein
MSRRSVYGGGYDVSESQTWGDRLIFREVEYPERRAEQGWASREHYLSAAHESDRPLAGSYLRQSESAEQRFIRLRNEWKAQRGHESSTFKVLMLPGYQKIIGMGSDAVPFLLRELETNLDNWFWALMAITENDPVPEEARGDGEAMAQAWLNWARNRGIEW